MTNSIGGGRVAIHRELHSDHDIITLTCGSVRRHFVTDCPGGHGSAEHLAEDIAAYMKNNGAAVTQMDLFGPCDRAAEATAKIMKAVGNGGWPVTWIDGEACAGRTQLGTQFYALSGTKIQPVMMDGERVGSLFEDDDARFLIMGALKPADLKASRADQAKSLFDLIERTVESVGMTFHHVVRTWLYVNKILDWYDDLNRVRNDFFKERGVFDRLVPASTGVGVGNPYGAAIVGDALAIDPKHDRIAIRALPSPLQCPAPAYGSAFSRAVEVAMPDYRRLYVSGTASIHPGGASAYPGDVDMQVDLTMRVVKAILELAQMDWSDVNRAVAYFKHMPDAAAYERWRKAAGVDPMPIVIVHADICRDDLLFEIEVDALKTC